MGGKRPDSNFLTSYLMPILGQHSASSKLLNTFGYRYNPGTYYKARPKHAMTLHWFTWRKSRLDARAILGSTGLSFRYKVQQ